MRFHVCIPAGTRWLAAVAATVMASLSGCSTPGTGEFQVPPGRYAAAFDATREVLLSNRFILERVDAQEGVITTRAKPSSGLGTPWDGEQSTLGQEIEDLAQMQQRRVRVTFQPRSGQDPSASEPDQIGSVEVVVERVYRTDWRPSTRAILLSGDAVDRVQAARGMPGWYEVALTRDDRFAARLADEVVRRLERGDAAQRSR